MWGKACTIHADCHTGLFCEPSVVWPWINECSPYKKKGEFCDDEMQCDPSSFCWFEKEADKKENVRKCLKMYNQDIGQQFGWYMEGATATMKDY